jgi:hypothetical protein
MPLAQNNNPSSASKARPPPIEERRRRIGAVAILVRGQLPARHRRYNLLPLRRGSGGHFSCFSGVIQWPGRLGWSAACPMRASGSISARTLASRHTGFRVRPDAIRAGAASSHGRKQRLTRPGIGPSRYGRARAFTTSLRRRDHKREDCPGRSGEPSSRARAAAWDGRRRLPSRGRARALPWSRGALRTSPTSRRNSAGTGLVLCPSPATSRTPTRSPGRYGERGTNSDPCACSSTQPQPTYRERSRS